MARSPSALSPSRSAFALLALGSLLACSDGSNPTPAPGPPAAIQVSPPFRSLTHLDETATLSAVVTDAAGTVLSDAVVAWISADAAVVSVDAQGTVTARGFGAASVTASVGSVSRSVSVTVTGEPDLAFLEGGWTVQAEVAPPGVASDGTVSVRPDQGGALRIVQSGTRDGAPVQAVALAMPFFNTGRWYLARVDGARGRYGVFDGTVAPGRIELSSGSRLGGAMRERVVLSEFRASSFRWVVEGSDDGGATWSRVEDAVWTRTGSNPVPDDLDTPSVACADADHRAFDFWRGNWTVTVPSGGVAGTNLVHLVAGCGVQENWRDAGSGGGVSLNGFDPVSERWGQFYVASTGGVLELWGTAGDDSMTLLGPQFGNPSVTDRIVWTRLADGRVRQRWDADAGGGWTLVFDGTYSPR